MKKFMVPRVARCKSGCQRRGPDPRRDPVFLPRINFTVHYFARCEWRIATSLTGAAPSREIPRKI